MLKQVIKATLEGRVRWNHVEQVICAPVLIASHVLIPTSLQMLLLTQMIFTKLIFSWLLPQTKLRIIQLLGRN